LDVRVQIHAMELDPIFVGDGDLDAARALAATTPRAELFLYPGDQHLFVDRFLPSYAADAATLLLRRAVAFLEAC
jgi:dienelactone hydrolase